MRKFLVVALVMSVLVGGSVFASPREDRTREPGNRIVKIVKRVVRSLGDTMTVPTPAPKP